MQAQIKRNAGDPQQTSGAGIGDKYSCAPELRSGWNNFDPAQESFSELA